MDDSGAKKQLTWREAIVRVLADAGPEGMNYADIANLVAERGFRTSLGATPGATVNAQITHEIKHSPDTAQFRKIAPGIFALRGGGAGNRGPSLAAGKGARAAGVAGSLEAARRLRHVLAPGTRGLANR